MSEELGPLTYSEERNAYLGWDMLQHKWFSNASVKMIDTEVRPTPRFLPKAFSLLETNRQVLDYLADQLIETETIDGNLVRETLKKSTCHQLTEESLPNGFLESGTPSLARPD